MENTWTLNIGLRATYHHHKPETLGFAMTLARQICAAVDGDDSGAALTWGDRVFELDLAKVRQNEIVEWKEYTDDYRREKQRAGFHAE